MVVAVVADSTNINPLLSQDPSLALLFSPWLPPLRHPPRFLSLSAYISMYLIVSLVIELGVKEKTCNLTFGIMNYLISLYSCVL